MLPAINVITEPPTSIVSPLLSPINVITEPPTFEEIPLSDVANFTTEPPNSKASPLSYSINLSCKTDQTTSVEMVLSSAAIAEIYHFIYDKTPFLPDAIALIDVPGKNKTSVNNSELVTSFLVSPKDIIKIPHASRTKSLKHIRRGKTVVITESPNKKELEDNKLIKEITIKKKKNKKNIKKRRYQ